MKYLELLDFIDSNIHSTEITNLLFYGKSFFETTNIFCLISLYNKLRTYSIDIDTAYKYLCSMTKVNHDKLI